jgi:hypothetical protein
MMNKLERDPQQMTQYIYSIVYECGRSYMGKTGRPLAVELCEHGHSIRESSRKIKISLICL